MKKAEFKAANGDELILTPSPINYENLAKEYPEIKTFVIIGTINAANEIDFEVKEEWVEKNGNLLIWSFRDYTKDVWEKQWQEAEELTRPNKLLLIQKIK